MIYYPRGMHKQTVNKNLNPPQGDFPNIEDTVQRCLALPMGPYLGTEDQKRIADAILAYVREK